MNEPVEPVTPTLPGAPHVPTGTREPAATPAADVPLGELSPEQLDALAARIEETRRNRPPSVAQQLADLQRSITETVTAKEEKVTERKATRDEADQLEARLIEIQETLRRTELIEAATAAGFKQPAVVADFLARTGAEGDIAKLVTDAAASGAFVMNQPKPSADIGGQQSKGAPGMDPGRAGLIAEIKAAQGR